MGHLNASSYKLVRDGIVNDILSGCYDDTGLLKGQEYYAQKHGVSRTTVRKAMQSLISKGMLYTIKGKGTYVNIDDVKKYSSERTLSFSAVERVKKLRLTSRVYSICEIKAENYISKQLQIEVGSKVVQIKRLRLVNNNPENYQVSYLDLEKVKCIDFSKEDLESGSLFKLLQEKAGLIAQYSMEEIRAVRCTEEIADMLQMESEDPVLFIMRTTYDKNNIPMEYCEDYECTDIKGLKIKNNSKDYYKKRCTDGD